MYIWFENVYFSLNFIVFYSFKCYIFFKYIDFNSKFIVMLYLNCFIYSCTLKAKLKDD